MPAVKLNEALVCFYEITLKVFMIAFFRGYAVVSTFDSCIDGRVGGSFRRSLSELVETAVRIKVGVALMICRVIDIDGKKKKQNDNGEELENSEKVTTCF